MIELRDYQLQAIDSLRDQFRAGKRTPMLQLPTGSGKTAIASEMIRCAVEKKTRSIFICDQISLIDQTSARLDEEGIPHGVIQGQHWRWRPHEMVQVCSIQTLARRKHLPEFSLAIIDEGHVLHEAHKKMMTEYSAVRFIGLSATPFARGLGKYFDSLVVGATTRELIQRGFLVKPYTFGPSKPDLEGVPVVKGDYDENALADRSNKPQLIADIVQTWKKLAQNRLTICFSVNIAHSKAIVERFNNEGIPAAHLDAYSSPTERKLKTDAFKRGDLRILSAVDLFSKGWDVPQVSCAILARATKSLMVYIQQGGRVLRTSDGKENALILDHAGNTERHGFLYDELPQHLDMGLKRKQKPREPEEKLPHPCPSCAYMKPPRVHKCPRCGFAPEKKNIIVEAPGELVAIDQTRAQRKANKELSPAEKRSFYSELLGYQSQRGYKDGWAANMYRKKTGVWPNSYRDCLPVEPSGVTLSWIKSRQIAYAKRRTA